MTTSARPLLRLSSVIALSLSFVSAAEVCGQVRVIDTPNLLPRAGTPGRFDTVVVRANAAPDTATDLAIITDVVVDSAGRILAVDARGQRLVILDAAGQEHGVIGRGGAGPGEFRFPYLATVTGDGTVVVFDQAVNRLTLFDRQLLLARTVALPGHLRASSMLAVGDQLLVAGVWNVPGAQDRAIHALSLDGTYLRSCGRLVDAAYPSVRAAIGGGILSPARSGGVWYTQRSPYLIERYAPDCTLQLQIRRPNDFLPSAESAFHVQVTESRTILMAPTPFARAAAIQELADGVVLNQIALPSGEVITDVYRPSDDGTYALVSSFRHAGPILLRRGMNGDFLSLFRADWNTANGVMVVRFTRP